MADVRDGQARNGGRPWVVAGVLAILWIGLLVITTVGGHWGDPIFWVPGAVLFGAATVLILARAGRGR